MRVGIRGLHEVIVWIQETGFIHAALLSTNVYRAAPVCSAPDAGIELVEPDTLPTWRGFEPEGESDVKCESDTDEYRLRL